MICLDTTFLSLLIHPDAKAPDNPAIGQPIERLKDRLDFVRKNWDADHEKIVIPTPVLCEFLILAGKDGSTYLEKIHKTSNFRVAAFDEMAAIELAAIQVGITNNKGKDKRDRAGGTWAKIKFDRQIVAIAKVNNATVIYTDDRNLKIFAEQNGIVVIQTSELPLPADPPPKLPFPEPKEDNDEQKTIKPSAVDIRGSIEGDAEDKARAATAENEISTEEGEN
jgi:predicted nucleic acid-binding protein